jgi:cytoskeletal protein RodZ
MNEVKSIELILKETRQARGIPIEAVHESTKIPLDVLKAIEEGYTVRALSSPFYRKQFIKMYATFLGVDVKDSMFVEPPKEEKAVPVFKKIPEKKVEPAATKPAGITLTKQQKQQIVLAIGALLLIFFLGKAFGFILHKMAQKKSGKKAVRIVKPKESKPAAKPKAKATPEKPAVKKETKKEEVKKEEIKKEEVKKEEPPQEEVKLEPPAPPPVPVAVAPVEEPAQEAKPIEPEPRMIEAKSRPAPENGKPVNLTVRAKKKGWLQVKVDGNTVFQSSLQKGAVENWQADDKIELTGNNILALELEVNGKMIGSVGRGGEGRARKLIVTKDGLSVKN